MYLSYEEKQVSSWREEKDLSLAVASTRLAVDRDKLEVYCLLVYVLLELGELLTIPCPSSCCPVSTWTFVLEVGGVVAQVQILTFQPWA